MHLALALLQQSVSDGSGAAGILAALVGVYLAVLLIALILVLIPFWFICKKAGFTPWLSLLNFVPFGTLILLYVLAFAEWKPQPQQQL